MILCTLNRRLVLPLCVLGSLAASAALAAPSAPIDRIQAIDEEESAGRIAEDLAAAYRVIAFTRPDLLPPEIALLPNPVEGCATPAFVRAFQLEAQGRMGQAAAQLYQYGTYRPTSVGYYDSAVYPVRVHYTASGLAAKAASVLDAVEYSWQRQTEVMGFRPPLGDFGSSEEGGTEALDIYVGDAQGAGGYTMPEYEWDATSWSDCTTSIVIDDSLTGADLQTTVAHELNHAMQAASDCVEWIAFWENTASYVMDVTYDGVNDYIYWVPEFQLSPWLPFERHEERGAYQYGGMVVAAVLDEAFGAGDGSKLGQVWRDCEQSRYYNSASYFEAISENASGGIDAFQATLTEWRYLTGSRSDGEHLSEASSWNSICYPHGDCEPPDDTQLQLSALPTSGTVLRKPNPHGSSYVRVNLGGSVSGFLYVVFNGDVSTRWAANVICWGTGEAVTTPLPVNSAGYGAASIPVTNQRNCTLAVSNMGPETYNPDTDYDGISGESHAYSYGFDFTNGTLTAPVINNVSPPQIPCTGLSSWIIEGSGFYQDPLVTLDDVALSVVKLTGTAITVSVPGRATSGHAQLTIVNRDGQSASRRIVFVGEGCNCDCDERTVCEEDCDCDPECLSCECDATDECEEDCDCDPDCDQGCGCALSDRSESITALLALLLIPAALRIRRRVVR